MGHYVKTEITIRMPTHEEITTVSDTLAEYHEDGTAIKFITTKDFTSNLKRGNIKELVIQKIGKQWSTKDFKCYITIQ